MSSNHLEKHNRAYERSGLTMKQYCQKHQISYYVLRNFRYQLHKKSREPNEIKTKPEKKFKMFDVGIKIQISFDAKGNLSLHGILPEHLPNILKVLHAIP